ncbi:MAG: T9SS type A sorting domain-containing protein [Bacteroidetes bacterium]|nr:T9SS type A sorting domain-containing protein [Bacteroidota bacterium]
MMSKINKSFLVLICLGLIIIKVNGQGQEIHPLKDNEAQQKQFEQWQRFPKPLFKKNLALPFFDDFSYADKFYYDTVNYKGVFPFDLLWANHQVFINNTMCDSAPSIGVVTFDGLNEKGLAYNPTGQKTSERADTLACLPIDMSGIKTSDSIYLSFYYQPKGLGEKPRETDSLTVEFRTQHGQWLTVWAVPGTGYKKFRMAMLKINTATDSFRYDGFQFRFVNYGNLTGNLDHWHVDYVYINAASQPRTMADSFIKDVALSRIPSSIFKEYFSVPTKQFYKNPNSFFADFSKAYVSNLDVVTANTNYKYALNLYPNNSPFAVTPPKQTISKVLLKESITSYEDSLNARAKAKILSLSGDTIKFLTKYIIKPPIQSNDYFENDSAQLRQEMSDYYAYDDGSAEFGYGLVGIKSGAAAQKFSLYADDKLYGVLIHFNQGMDNAKQSFNLKVWSSIIGGTNNATEVGSADNQKVQYSDFTNGWVYYPFSAPVDLQKGDFFVGWSQTQNFYLNVGYDVNYQFINAGKINSNLYYNVGSKWEINNTLNGALMMRPYFGKNAVGIDAPNTLTHQIRIYPNPAIDVLNIIIADIKTATISIKDITGREVYTHPTNTESTQIDCSGFAKGIYVITLTTPDGAVVGREKFVKR